jgi:hypothetical protein
MSWDCVNFLLEVQMPNGCLFALLGLGRSGNTPTLSSKTEQMGEGEIHSGPAGYEDMGYSGGYAAEYHGETDSQEHDANGGGS